MGNHSTMRARRPGSGARPTGALTGGAPLRALTVGAPLRALTVGALLLALLLPATGSAQAGLSPLSGSKLRVPSADPVPEGHVELGFHFQMAWSSRAFGDAGRILRTETRDTDALLGLRVAWGILDQQHLGMELSSLLPLIFRFGEDPAAGTTYSHTGLGDVPLGLKLRIFSHRDFSIALAFLGVVPTGDRHQLNLHQLAPHQLTPPRGQLGTGLPMTGHGRVGAGFLVSARVKDGLTLDVAFTGEGTTGLRETERHGVAAWGMETSLALSWVERRGFFRVFTPCLELGHRVEGLSRGDPDARIRQRLSLNAGFAIQLTRRIVMTQAAQVDLAGTRMPMGAGWIMGTTILL